MIENLYEQCVINETKGAPCPACSFVDEIPDAIS